MKFCLEDISILDRYELINNAIKGKFESIDALGTEMGYSSGTLSRYLRDPELLSPGKHDKLKSKVFRYLGQSLVEILPNEDEQIKDYIDALCTNVDEYSSEEDASVFERLESSCLQYNIKMHLAHLYQAWGKYCFNMKIPLQAIVYYWKAIDIYKNNYDWSNTIKCYNDLGFISNNIGNYEEARRLFLESDTIIKHYNNIDQENLFYHYFRWGIVLNKEQVGEHTHAREKFYVAINHATGERNCGSVYLNIGLSYKKEKQYSQARKYYEIALETYGDEFNALCGIVYNNLAELEKTLGNYDKALWYINKALKKQKDLYDQHYLVSFNTYAEIQALRGQTGDTLKTLLALIENSRGQNYESYYVLDAIKSVLKFGDLETGLLIELKNVVYNLIESADDKSSKHFAELMQCLGEVDWTVYKSSQGI